MATQNTKNVEGIKVSKRQSFISLQTGEQTISGSLTITGTTNFVSASSVSIISGADVPVVSFTGTGSTTSLAGFSASAGIPTLSTTGSGGIVTLGVNQDGSGTATDVTAVKLPTPEAGLNYRFFCSASAADSGDIKIMATSDGSTTAALFFGLLSSSKGERGKASSTPAVAHAADTAPSYSIWLGSGSANWTPGDNAYVISDGTYWYARGITKVNNAVSFDSASNAFSPIGQG